MTALDAAVADRAREQHGLVSVAQLRALGATRGTIRTHLDHGDWTPAAHGVLRIGGAPVTWESRLMAHVLAAGGAAGGAAVASHRAAAALWNLDSRRQVPEVTVPRGRRYRPAEARVHASTDLHLIRPIRRFGVPATPVSRTLLDLGAVVSRQRVHLAVEEARRRRLTDWEALLATLVAHARRGRRGVAALRSILDQHFGEVAVTDSGFERLVVAALRQAGLPPPELQHEVCLRGRRYRLDVAYPGAMVGIELDGSYHLRREVWQADHARQNALILAGWTLLRFTWRDYLDRRPALVREIRAALAAA